MALYDVAIIGGGVIGVAIARELSFYKLKAVLLEKEEELAFGVSKSNSGIIHPGTQIDPTLLKGRLCVDGNRLIRRVSRELGADFKEIGELIVAFGDDEVPLLVKLKKDAESLGVPGLRIVYRTWLAANEPNLSSEVVAALYAPSAGIISPYRLVYDMSENAVKNGVEIRTGSEVKKITLLGVSVSGKDARFEIETARGSFSARYIVNAAGLYADRVSEMVGVNDFSVFARKGEEFILDKKKEYLTRHLIFPLPSQNSKGVLVIKTADGNPMIGPTADDIRGKDDLSTTDAGFKRVLLSARKLVPSIREDDIIAYFAGLRPAAGNDFIIRHEEKVPGFVNVAGIQSPGLTAAPAIAVLVWNILKSNGLAPKKKFTACRSRKKSVHLFRMKFPKARRLIKNNPAYGDMVCRCEMVSAGEIKDAVCRGARTLDGIKFRTRAQAGRCHGSFCTIRIMKILAAETGKPLSEITKRGAGSEIVKGDLSSG